MLHPEDVRKSENFLHGKSVLEQCCCCKEIQVGNWVGFIVSFLRCNYLISSQPGNEYCKLHILTLNMITILTMTSCFIIRQQSICSPLQLLVSFSSLLWFAAPSSWVIQLSLYAPHITRNGWETKLSSTNPITSVWTMHAVCWNFTFQLYVLYASILNCMLWQPFVSGLV